MENNLEKPLDSLISCRSCSKKSIKGITYDSRKVEKDFLFVAIQGFMTDGHKYIESAIENGATAVVHDIIFDASVLKKKYPGVTFCQSSNSRAELSTIAAKFYDYPTKEMKIFAVTGTNGKTTTTYILKKIFEAYGEKSGLIGTIQNVIDDEIIESEHTTPEAADLHAMFASMKTKGVKAAAIEISSHALTLNRCDDIEFGAVIFSNITEDHLDFHKTMSGYLKAKLLSFEILARSNKVNKIALINVHSHSFETIAQKALMHPQIRAITYGIEAEATYSAKIKEMSIKGLKYELYHKDKYLRDIELSLTGKFNVLNSLSAIAAAMEAGYPLDTFADALKEIQVPGRFEVVTKKSDPYTVVVDYAHTDDALTNVLQTARELKPVKIITVFGCGGDRDRAKRPLMAQAVGSLSDYAILTCDNPRTEDISQIMSDTIVGLENTESEHEIIIDRKEAIEKAISLAEENTLVLIAGKGHETYQIFKDKTIHFDDREVAREAISKLSK